jgi:putative ABC transport system substrate-binding protein
VIIGSFSLVTDCVTLLGGAAAWPLGAPAQQRSLPVIGFLHSQTPAGIPERVTGFHRGLAEQGYVEHRNVAIEYRWADGHNDRLAAHAADLVARRVTVIAALGSTATALAAKAATDRIPIVFLVAADPVETGLVASLNRPSGNITGVANLNIASAGKRLAFLREIVAKAATVAFLTNPTNPVGNVPERREVEAAAAALRLRLVVLDASDPIGIEAVFEGLARQPVDAMIVSGDPLFPARRVQLAVAASINRLPTIYPYREMVEAGGLVSYGSLGDDVYRQAGVFVGRILKGEKPADLPVMQPTRFQLVINRGTARLLRIEIPDTMLAIADEVIE